MAEPGQGSDTSVAQWLELFFDLVVVAAVAVITEGVVEDPTWVGVGLAAVTYAAIWQSWLSVVLYANVAERQVRTRTVVIAMFAIALMAASVPGHFDQRANVFVLGFLVARSAAAGAAQRTGRVLTSYPLLQAGGLSLPWIISLWVDVPAKYWLWGLGLVLDFAFLLARSQQGDAAIEAMQARRDRAIERHGPSDRGPKRSMIRFEAVDVDTAHLDERLGLFVIIVLGEVVAQIVRAAAGTEWADHFVVTAASSFALIVGVWWLMFSAGAREATHTRIATLPPRLALPIHLVSTFGIVLLASGLGASIVAPDRSIDPALARIMAAGLAIHLAATTTASFAAGASRRWIALVGVPSVLACVAVTLVTGRIDDNKQLIVVLLLIVLWAVGWSLWGRRDAVADDAEPVG